MGANKSVNKNCIKLDTGQVKSNQLSLQLLREILKDRGVQVQQQQMQRFYMTDPSESIFVARWERWTE